MSEIQSEEKPKKARGRRRKDEQAHVAVLAEEATMAKEESKKQVGIKFDVYCAIRKIAFDRIPGMAAYKGAKKLILSLPDWDKHFDSY